MSPAAHPAARKTAGLSEVWERERGSAAGEATGRGRVPAVASAAGVCVGSRASGAERRAGLRGCPLEGAGAGGPLRPPAPPLQEFSPTQPERRCAEVSSQCEGRIATAARSAESPSCGTAAAGAPPGTFTRGRAARGRQDRAAVQQAAKAPQAAPRTAPRCSSRPAWGAVSLAAACASPKRGGGRLWQSAERRFRSPVVFRRGTGRACSPSGPAARSQRLPFDHSFFSTRARFGRQDGALLPGGRLLAVYTRWRAVENEHAKALLHPLPRDGRPLPR